jgi:hypothetical protein
MHKTFIRLAILSGLLLMSACSASGVFDTNCSGDGFIQNPTYCTDVLHPNAGPWAPGRPS